MTDPFNNPFVNPPKNQLFSKSFHLRSHLLRHRHSNSNHLPIPILPPIDDSFVHNSHISSIAHRFRACLSRPCFEDRFTVWLPSHNSSGFISQIVTTSGFAVAELEFSDALQIMAELDQQPSPSPPELQVTAPQDDIPEISPGNSLFSPLAFFPRLMFDFSDT
jgi:hypothetical protein